jgi:TRAP-type C4-dicarboxylate transport system substrate-binding protein
MMRKWQILVVISIVCIMVLGVGWVPEVSAKKYKWRLTQVMPEDSDQHRRAAAFANEVKVKTEGRIDITIYSGGTLCDWVECHERVMRGDYEMALQPLAPTYDPRLNIGYYMPYLFTSTKEAKKAYKRGGWVYTMVDELLVDQGIKGLALFPMGWAGVTTREVPDGWREMKPNKMKIRVMPLKACELTWQRLGYIPSTIPYNEAFSAIERGVADGESGGPPFQGYQFRDIQGVWIQYNDYLEPWWFFMNLKLFNKLDKKRPENPYGCGRKTGQGPLGLFSGRRRNLPPKIKGIRSESSYAHRSGIKELCQSHPRRCLAQNGTADGQGPGGPVPRRGGHAGRINAT